MGTIRRTIWIMVLMIGAVYGADMALAADGVVDAVVTAVGPVADASVIPAPPEQLPWWGSGLQTLLGNFPEVNGWLIAVLAFLMVGLRAASELFAFIASKTESKTDDKWAANIARLSWWAASLFGWFGGGKSKKLEDKSK